MITRSEEIDESPGGKLSIEFYLEMAEDKFPVKAHQRTMTRLGISIVLQTRITYIDRSVDSRFSLHSFLRFELDILYFR